ncbi:MAG: DNA ligase D [Phycisphaerales bacterium]
MTLTAYRRKRDFKITAEPRGKAMARGKQLRFVVQKHAATSLHYDFRLELDGALKSWAVPKGPSLDPTRKALAIEVEDHPIDYANFEGEIPAGQYGAGQVIVWDRGVWVPEGDPHAGLAKGHLKFTLRGKKLSGVWSLVRMQRTGTRNQWLLMKHADEHARPESDYNILTAEPRSVISRRTIEARTPRHKIRARIPAARRTKPAADVGSNGRHSIAKSPRARRSPRTARTKPEDVDGARDATMPTSLHPQLATLVESPPKGPDWVHEVKFDGYRLLAFKRGERARLITRNGLDWTHRFQSIADEVANLDVDSAILDGEVVALDEHGTPRFQQLQNAGKPGSPARLACFFFDLPYCDGFDLTHTRLLDRRSLLKQLLADTPSETLRYSEHFTEPGSDLLQLVCSRNLEGIISKRAGAPYQQRRTRDWVKSKCSLSQEMVIGGYTPPKRSRAGFGSLLLGCHDRHGRLVYRGRVGAGFDERTLRSLHSRFRKLERQASPFGTPPPRDVSAGVRWVEPQVVIEATFHELTHDGRVRQGVFRGIREDKPASEVVCEVPKPIGPSPSRTKEPAMPTRTPRKSQTRVAASRSSGKAPAAQTPAIKPKRSGSDRVEIAGVSISHPDARLFPESNITKLDLANYYDAVADLMLPHVVDRPLMIVRCPDGGAGSCFHQKHVTPGFPAAIGSVPIREKDKTERTIVIHDRAGLVSLVQVRALEIHSWGATADDPDSADRLVFDLDPGAGIAWSDLVAAAVLLRQMLQKLGLESFVKTSGSKGLHVVIPLKPAVAWSVAKAFTRAIAERLAADYPDRYVSRMDKSLRRGRIFVDYLRNGRGATCVTAFSARARPGAPISVPVAWNGLVRLKAADAFTIANAVKHLQAFRAAWSGYDTLRQSLPRGVGTTETPSRSTRPKKQPRLKANSRQGHATVTAK